VPPPRSPAFDGLLETWELRRALNTSVRTLLCPGDPTLVDIQTRNNLETAGHWNLYAEHRQRVDELLQARAPGDRLCILGAGNANSHDLQSLAARFAEVHLVDLDPIALDLAVERQAPAARDRIALHAPIDLSGILALLPAWRGLPPSIAELESLSRSVPDDIGRALPGPFDVVVSDCLFTQISWTCFKALGNGAVLRSVLLAALEAHLRTLVALTKPGGSCVFVTDAASGEDISPQDLLSEKGGLHLIQELDRRGRLFSGTSLAVVLGVLRDELQESIESVEVVSPWLWQFLEGRSALVYAVTFHPHLASP